MRISLIVKPGAGKNQVIKKSEGVLAVYVTAAPEKGKANGAVIKLLADYFGIAKSRIRIISGFSSKNKIVKILSM
ncbi:MAG: DUF167 domain-containing protein [Candidatus Sungbacteria bacterium]|nr:DUF167 domain-containing protein [Candidatus Sungbacteria bacterium]